MPLRLDFLTDLQVISTHWMDVPLDNALASCGRGGLVAQRSLEHFGMTEQKQIPIFPTNELSKIRVRLCWHSLV